MPGSSPGMTEFCLQGEEQLLGGRLVAPARGRGVVARFGLDPARAGRSVLALPERRARLEIVHEKARRLERGLAMLRRRDDENDIVAGLERAVTVHDEARLKREARARLGLDACELRLGHAGIML